MIEMLPGDKEHPPRPNLPIWNHLTYDEAHAMELGVGIAVFVYLAAVSDQLGMAVSILGYIVRMFVGKTRAKYNPKKCDHTLGFHDIKGDPWYFVVAGLLAGAALILVFGIP